MKIARPKDEWRHLALLISILILFIITPAVVALRQGVVVMNILATIVFVTGSYALSPRKQLFAVAMALSAITVSVAFVLLYYPKPWLRIFSTCCIIVLVSYFSITILGYVLRGTRVTTDKIFAAICVYLLIGYAWTFAYALVDELQHGAFMALSAPQPNDQVARILEMRYFSFVTLTTVGYGDIVPHSPTARTMAVLEAVTGQIYLTVLIARLVGLHIVHANTSPNE
jgi:hypothetical protein